MIRAYCIEKWDDELQQYLTVNLNWTTLTYLTKRYNIDNKNLQLITCQIKEESFESKTIWWCSPALYDHFLGSIMHQPTYGG